MSADPTGGSTPAVEARSLTKAYGDVLAVQGVDLVVRAGSVHAVLGPNGAGKTTTVRMLATLVRPDSGSIRVLGRDALAEAPAVRTLIGLTGQFASVDADLTGRESLVLLARLRGYRGAAAHHRADELIDAFGLSDAAGRSARSYSGGMRRRLDLAASMTVRPMVLYLDEPTTGLDPASRAQVWGWVARLAREGTAVLLTTQNLEEADRLADAVTVIDHGRVVATGTPAQLKQRIGAGVLRVRIADRARVEEAEAFLAARGLATRAEGGSELVTSADPVTAAGAVSGLEAAGIRTETFALGQPSLEDVFHSLTGDASATTGALVEEPA